MPDNTGEKQGNSSQFTKGKSGNPSGRPKGSLNKATLAAQALLEGEAELITHKLIDMAKEGDITAIKLIIERILPQRKDRPIIFNLPEIEALEDIAKANAAIIKSVTYGEITPLEGSSITKMLENLRKTIETQDLEIRMNNLEKSIKRKVS